MKVHKYEVIHGVNNSHYVKKVYGDGSKESICMTFNEEDAIKNAVREEREWCIGIVKAEFKKMRTEWERPCPSSTISIFMNAQRRIVSKVKKGK